MIGLDDIQGHWRRRWLRAPGFEDSTTRVHWMQAGDVYADVRIPLDRPDLGGATRLSDLSAAALVSLLAAEGFAGRATVEGGVCTWARHINWHGATSDIDAGRLSFESDGDLIEDGIYADYAERWTRPSAVPRTGQRYKGQDCLGYLVTVGGDFVFGLGRVDAPGSQDVMDALERGDVWSDGLADLFERVHVLGRWQEETGVTVLCTNPFAEGLPCLFRTGKGLRVQWPDWHGSLRELTLEPA